MDEELFQILMDALHDLIEMSAQNPDAAWALPMSTTAVVLAVLRGTPYETWAERWQRGEPPLRYDGGEG